MGISQKWGYPFIEWNPLKGTPRKGYPYFPKNRDTLYRMESPYRSPQKRVPLLSPHMRSVGSLGFIGSTGFKVSIGSRV